MLNKGSQIRKKEKFLGKKGLRVDLSKGTMKELKVIFREFN